jgi:dTDP-4-amino-4,6-dideoxygalactose transaminase
MTNRIHLSKADVTEVEEQYVLNALRSGWIAPLGPDVEAFESEIAARVGVRHALALSSGTAALHLALLGIGAGPSTAVLLPSMTFAASANAVTYTGSTPVFVDSEPHDGNVDPELLLKALDELIAAGHDVAAVMTVDLFGRPADYDRIAPALEERGVPLIEDAAEALGASSGERAAGSFGRAAALSFNGNKIMTTSGGGMLVSNDEAFVSRARKLSTQAREDVPWYEHTETGYNYRLSNILAALGRGQLTRLDGMIERRRQIRRQYERGIDSLGGVTMLGGDAGSDNCWLTCVTLDPDTTAVDADMVISDLNRMGIEARHLWKPMHLQPLFVNARALLNGTSESLFRRGIALPSGANLTDADIDRVIDAIARTLSRGQ